MTYQTIILLLLKNWIFILSILVVIILINLLLKRKYILIHIISFILLIIFICVGDILIKTPNTDYEIIMHAGGGDLENELTYLNSIDMFEYYYNQGIRYFEYDFMYSSDNLLIGIHKWEDYFDNIITYEEYNNFLFNGLYKGITIYDIETLLSNYDDIYIILDTKETDVIDVYEDILDLVSPQYISRIIPQIYNCSMYYELENIYDFDNYIFTLYKTLESNKTILNFIKDKEDIKVVTISTVRFVTPYFINKVKDYGKEVYIHTINDFYLLKFYQELGIEAFYSDYLVK